MKVSGRFSRIGGVAIAVALMLSQVSCQMAQNQMDFDRPAELSLQDYRDAFAPLKEAPADTSAAPAFEPVVSTPDELKLPTPLVTVEVNQSVSLRDLLYQLAQQAEIDLELDPQIRGSIIFTAKDRPFDQVIERITTMASLRYKFANGVLRVELDRPYIKNYKADFLNVERKGDSSIKTSSSSSDSNTTNKIASDLWKELNDGLEQVLSASDTHISLATLSDPQASIDNPLPAPVPSADPNAPPPPPPLPGSPEVAPIPASQSPVVRITTPTAAPLVPNPPSTFAISKQTGVISVFTTERQHKLVKKFIDDYRRRVTTQVLIEAKVLQVDLNDQFATGIDWGSIELSRFFRLDAAFPSPGLTGGTGSLSLGFARDGADFRTVVQAMSGFGTVRALSSPRVTVLNNQPAVVNVTRDHQYVILTATVTPSTTSGIPPTVGISSELKNAPDGVILTVIPTANADTGEITLTLRPTVSKKVDDFTDPTLRASLALAGAAFPAGLNDPQIPELTVQEVDSILHMQSGQMVALGGLMRDENLISAEGVPVLSDMPVVGSLFKNHKDTVAKSELVILVRAHIIDGVNLDDTEKKFYKGFGLDRHPGPL